MPRRKPIPPMTSRPGPLSRLLNMPDETSLIDPARLARGRALDVLGTVPSRYITTKSVLDTYLDSIGVGR
jgi:hypothetical protein